MKYRNLLCAVVAVLALSLLGCAKDSGQSNVQYKPTDNADLQKKIEDVQNNPNIPAAQKQQIISRLQSQPAYEQASKEQAQKENK